MRPPEIAVDLRRELRSFYPYLSTLRLQGGELFAIRGFRELVDEVAAVTNRPLLSISTNGTLIDEEWAEKIVRTPFSHVTFSIDGGTPGTYARMRVGADLNQVLANLRRIQNWKAKLNTALPFVDSFFVVMRSNFREIPVYLELMHGVIEVTLEFLPLSDENLGRHRDLQTREEIADAAEVHQLHGIMRSRSRPPAPEIWNDPVERDHTAIRTAWA